MDARPQIPRAVVGMDCRRRRMRGPVHLQGPPFLRHEESCDFQAAVEGEECRGVVPELFHQNFTVTVASTFVEYIYEDEWTNPITRELGTTTIAFSPSVLFNNAFNFSFRERSRSAGFRCRIAGR